MKKYWNIGKCIANVSLAVFMVLSIAEMVMFFGGPLFHTDSTTYVGIMTKLTYVNIGAAIVTIIAHLCKVRIRIK